MQLITSCGQAFRMTEFSKITFCGKNVLEVLSISAQINTI